MTADSPRIVGCDETAGVARGHLYSFLASAFSDPAGKHFETALDPGKQRVVSAAAALLASEAPRDVRLGPGEGPPDKLTLAPAVKELQAPRGRLIEEHQKVFGLLIGQTAPLNETEYCRSTDAFFRAQQLADIGGFYKAFGLARSAEGRERLDHLSLDLEFMAHLMEKELFAAASSDPSLREKAGVCRDGQRNFLEAHLLLWVPGFAELLRTGTTAGLYAELDDSLAAFIVCERVRFSLAPSAGLAGSIPTQTPNPEESAGQSCSGH